MSLQRLQTRITPRFTLPIPNLNRTVAATRDKPPQRLLLLLRRTGRTARSTRNKARCHAGSPSNRIHANTVRRNHNRRPHIIPQLNHADLAVGAGTGKQTAALGRRPSHQIHTRRVVGIVECFAPLSCASGASSCSPALGSCTSGLAPDDDAAIVRARGEECAEFGVRPGYAPHGAGVALESVGEAVGVVGLDGEDFDGQVGGTGCESAAVVIEDGIVLNCS